jgi:hypothetical protein
VSENWIAFLVALLTAGAVLGGSIYLDRMSQ